MLEEHPSYFGFDAVPSAKELIDALIHDPPDVRWRIVRTILRIKSRSKLGEILRLLQNRAESVWTSADWRIRSRLKLAMDAMQRPVRVQGYAVVKAKGAFSTEELEAVGYCAEKLDRVKPDPDLSPLVDFHVHPKIPDLKFLSDLRKAGISHAVILATDTDPMDVDRPEIIERLRMSYVLSEQSRRVPFAKYLEFIRSDLYSSTHVTNRDVADWVADYPETLIGFGSVNLSKSKEYITKTLDSIEKLGLKGIKLLPYSQFFNPAENENMDTLFAYCRRTGSPILSHSGCAAGPFELVELSQDSRPKFWEPMAQKYPDVPIVLAHFGSYSSHYPGIWFDEAVEIMKKCQNMYADISAAPYLFDDEEKIQRIRDSIGFGRILFATDYPGPLYYGISLAGIVQHIKANPLLAEEEKDAVLGQSAKKLLEIE